MITLDWAAGFPLVAGIGGDHSAQKSKRIWSGWGCSIPVAVAGKGELERRNLLLLLS